jgi:hypothetical protein
MKSRLFVPFFMLAGVILLVGLACGATATTTPTQPPIQIQSTLPPNQIQPTQPPPVQGNEIRQWAVSAVASSQFGSVGWTASDATGAPNTTDCGDHTTAWASASSNTVEWIELSYATPVYATEVVIYQTYNPSSIVKVELIDQTGGYHEVYSAQPKALQCPQTLTISFQQTDYQVAGLRITVDQSVLQGWNEIDAVELAGIGNAALLPPETQPTQAPVEASAYFTEEFNSEPANWEILMTHGNPEKYTTEFSGSRMIFDLEDLDIYLYYIFQGQSYSDVRLDINAENRGKNNNNVSLVCRKSDEGWYEFSTEGGGLWYLYAATPDQDGKINYDVIDNGGAISLKQGKAVNEYTMICKGTDITLMINGVEVKKVKDKIYAFRDGNVGFNISSLNVTPIIVEVDWFKVSEP